MDLLSPLSRLLGFSGTLSETSSSSQTTLDKSLPARAQGATKVSTLAPTNISSSILTQTTRASTSEQNLLAQLRSLAPQALRSFISQRLPFLDDPRFVLALARAIGETQQAGRNSSARNSSASNFSGRAAAKATDGNSPEQNKVKTSSESTAKADSAKPATSYQLRDRSGIIWRAWFLPIALEGRLDRVGIYHTRRRNRDSGKESDRDGKQKQEQNSSRLVFAIEFAHIGALEIEAEHSDGKLRMILRSTNSFSLAARAGIQAKFSEILQDLGLQGQLVFHKVDTLPMSSLSASEESLATAEDEYDEGTRSMTRGMMTKVAHLDDDTSSDTDKTNWEIKL